MQIFAAIVNAAQWKRDLSPSDQWEFFTCGLDGVDIRWANPPQGPSKAESDLAELAFDAGLFVRAHGWTGRTDLKPSKVDGKEGRRSGFEIGKHAEKHGICMFSGNHEKGVWWGGDKNANPGANAFITEFAAALLVNNVAPGELGYSDPSWHYPGAKIEENSKRYYARKHAMAYQGTFKSISSSLSRARKVWETHPITAWLGVGRIDGTGNPVGNYDASKLVALERPSDIDQICFYFGNGSSGQALRGNPKHKSIRELIHEIKSA